tara:strand:+ start:627 stop:1580 length:954 start_codon:yes stop_codon:yes gene_type:complete
MELKQIMARSKSGIVDIKLGGYQPASSVHNRAAEILKIELTDRVGDDVSFQIDGNMTLSSGIKAFDLPKLVESGNLSMCYFASSYLADRVPEVAIFDMPFVIGSRQKFYQALDGELGKLFEEKFLNEMGVRILAFWDNGLRHLSNRVREIRSPFDCEKLKIRSMNSEIHKEFFSLLGFEPVYIDVADLVAQVKSGEIDAQENPLTNTYNFGTYKYHRYITLTGHFFGTALLMVNESIYGGWSSEIKMAMGESVKVATQKQRSFAEAEDEQILKLLDDCDNIVTTLSPKELEGFKTAVKPLVYLYRRTLGDHLFSLVE